MNLSELQLDKKHLNKILLISSLAGLVAVFIFRRNLSAEVSLADFFGLISNESITGVTTVSSIREIFRVPIMGFIYYDFFDIVNVALVTILFIPVLYFCYIKSKWAGISGLVLLISCLCMYIVSNPTLLLFNNLENTGKLENIIDRIPLKTVLSSISLFLLYFFGLFITVLLKKLNLFSKYTFILGLLTNVIGLFYFPLTLIIGEMNYLAIVLSAPFTVIWHANIALNLYKMRKKK